MSNQAMVNFCKIADLRCRGHKVYPNQTYYIFRETDTGFNCLCNGSCYGKLKKTNCQTVQNQHAHVYDLLPVQVLDDLPQQTLNRN